MFHSLLNIALLYWAKVFGRPHMDLLYSFVQSDSCLLNLMPSLSPNPTYEREGLVASDWFLGLHWFLSTNHIAEKTISSAAPEILGYFSTMTRHFLAHKFIISSQLCIQQAMKF